MISSKLKFVSICLLGMMLSFLMLVLSASVKNWMAVTAFAVCFVLVIVIMCMGIGALHWEEDDYYCEWEVDQRQTGIVMKPQKCGDQCHKCSDIEFRETHPNHKTK